MKVLQLWCSDAAFCIQTWCKFQSCFQRDVLCFASNSHSQPCFLRSVQAAMSALPPLWRKAKVLHGKASPLCRCLVSFFSPLWVRCERVRRFHTFTHTPRSVVFGPDFVRTLNNSKVFSHPMPVLKSTCLHHCREHRIVFDLLMSASAKRSARERQKSPNMLSLSGIVSTMCRKNLFHLTSLFVSFTDAGEQSKRRLLVSGTQVHRTRCKTHEKTQLVWHRTTIPAVPRDKLVGDRTQSCHCQKC